MFSQKGNVYEQMQCKNNVGEPNDVLWNQIAHTEEDPTPENEKESGKSQAASPKSLRG